MRWGVGVCLLMAGLIGTVRAEEPRKGETPPAAKPGAISAIPLVPKAIAAKPDIDRAAQLKRIQTAYQQACENFVERLSEAKTPSDQQDLLPTRPNVLAFAMACRRLVDADPKDETAFEALRWMLRFSNAVAGDRLLAVRPAPGTKPAPAWKPLDVLAEHHLANPKMGELCLGLSERIPEAEKFLLTVLDKAESAKAKGPACFRLGQYRQREAENEGLTAADRENFESKAETFYERVRKDFAGVEVGKTTLGKLAADNLYAIHNLTLGKKLPELNSEDLDGKKVKLSDYRGKVVVLDVWATWCGPCRAMIPHKRELAARLKDKPFALISISFDAEKETLTKFLAKEEMPWQHWFNGREGEIHEKLQIQFFPTIYVLDAKGVVRYKGVRGQKMDEAVGTLLAELAEKKPATK